MIPLVGRMTIEVDGARVVVAPFTMADMEAARSAGGMEMLELFASHIEEPADFAERFGMPWVGAACYAWQAAVGAFMAKLASPNRAARRRLN